MKRLAKTYVWHGEKCFFVSTINRESSAMVEPPPHQYAETLVWIYDWDAPDGRQDLIHQGEAGRDSIRTHQEIVANLAATGRCT